METSNQTPSLEESVTQVMQTLPPAIRTYLSQGKYTLVAKGLMSKYGLHIDQGTVVEREIMLLIMGIENPDEFTQALAEEASIDAQTINGIVQDVNDQIFIPLRTQMKNEGGAVGQQTKPAAVPAVGPSQGIPAPRSVNALVPPIPSTAGVPSYAPPLQSPRYSYPENLMPTHTAQPQPQSISRIAPLPPKNVLPRPSAISNIGGRPAATPAPKTIDASRMLEDHEQPHIEFNKIPPAPSVPVREGSAETPLRQALRTVMPPQNLPGAMPQNIAPGARYSSYTVTPKAGPITPPIQPKPISPPAPLNTSSREASGEHFASQNVVAAKPYSSDPYREPVE